MSPSHQQPEHRLRVRASHPLTEIEVRDAQLRTVALPCRLGEVECDLPAGLYQVRFRVGGLSEEHFVDLTAGEQAVEQKDHFPIPATMPLPNSSTWVEEHGLAARKASKAGPALGQLWLFLRDQERHPIEETIQLTLVPQGPNQSIEAPERSPTDEKSDWRSWFWTLAAGAYTIRLDGKGGYRVLNQAVFVAAGWQTQIFLVTAESHKQPLVLSRVAQPPRRVEPRWPEPAWMSFRLVHFGEGFDPQAADLRDTEQAILALQTAEPGPEWTPPLTSGQCPALDLLLAFLCLKNKEKFKADVVCRIVLALARELQPVPSDVLALVWQLKRCDALAGRPEAEAKEFAELLRKPVQTLPMLRAAWDVLVEASGKEPCLMPPGCFAARIAPAVTAGPGVWLNWVGAPGLEEKLPSAAPKPDKALQIIRLDLLDLDANRIDQLLSQSKLPELALRVIRCVFPLVANPGFWSFLKTNPQRLAEERERLKEQPLPCLAGVVGALHLPAGAILPMLSPIVGALPARIRFEGEGNQAICYVIDAHGNEHECPPLTKTAKDRKDNVERGQPVDRRSKQKQDASWRDPNEKEEIQRQLAKASRAVEELIETCFRPGPRGGLLHDNERASLEAFEGVIRSLRPMGAGPGRRGRLAEKYQLLQFMDEPLLSALRWSLRGDRDADNERYQLGCRLVQRINLRLSHCLQAAAIV